VIGMVGLIEDVGCVTTSWFKHEGDIIYLLGSAKNELGGTEYLRVLHNKTEGLPPRLDMEEELRLQKTLLSAIEKRLVRSAHDISDGGFAVALAEGCLGDKEQPLGVEVALETADGIRVDALLFGESQSRVIVSVAPEDHGDFNRLLTDSNQEFRRIGVVGGKRLIIKDLIDLPLSDLSDTFYNTLPKLAV